jgi:hypothetical protein
MVQGLDKFADVWPNRTVAQLPFQLTFFDVCRVQHCHVIVMSSKGRIVLSSKGRVANVKIRLGISFLQIGFLDIHRKRLFIILTSLIQRADHCTAEINTKTAIVPERH